MLKVTLRAITYNKKLLDDERIVTAARRYMVDRANEVMEEMKYYPPQPPDSKYERTYTLFSDWTYFIEQRARGLFLFITNYVRYAKYVQGPNQQAIFESIGWIKLKDSIDRIRQTYRSDLQEIINRYRYK